MTARVYVVLPDADGALAAAPADVVRFGRLSADVLVGAVPHTVPLSSCFLDRRGADAAVRSSLSLAPSAPAAFPRGSNPRSAEGGDLFTTGN